MVLWSRWYYVSPVFSIMYHSISSLYILTSIHIIVFSYHLAKVYPFFILS